MGPNCLFLLLLALFAAPSSAAGPKLGLGDVCVPNQDACDPTEFLECDETEKKCVCQQRYFLDLDDSCQPPLNRLCSVVNKQCNLTPYALCSTPLGPESKCQCTKGYIQYGIYCKAENIGGHCLEDGQCQENGECVQEKCTCKSGFVQDGKACKPVSGFLGDKCEVNAQCTAVDASAVCTGLVNRQCKCEERFFVADQLNVKCIPIARQIGDACSTNEQCSKNFGMQASCASGVCSCRSGFVASLDSVNCLPETVLGGACVQDQQCSSEVAGSECFELECTCQVGFDTIAGKCSKKPELLGDSCLANDQCDDIHPEAECKDELCQCSMDYVATEDKKKCLKGANLLDDQCSDNVQCSANIANSACDTFTSTCRCTNSFVPSSDRKHCYPKVTGPNDACMDNGQCTAAVPGEVECRDKKCQCKPNCHYYDAICWKTLVLGERCADSRECRLSMYSDRVECRGSVCACKAGFAEDRVQNKCNSGTLVAINVLLTAAMIAVLKAFV